jgi:hypothetical protein
VYWVVKLLWFNSIDAICSLPLCGYLLVALRCDALKPKMSGQWLLHILVMCSSFSWCILHVSSCSFFLMATVYRAFYSLSYSRTTSLLLGFFETLELILLLWHCLWASPL